MGIVGTTVTTSVTTTSVGATVVSVGIHADTRAVAVLRGSMQEARAIFRVANSSIVPELAESVTVTNTVMAACALVGLRAMVQRVKSARYVQAGSGEANPAVAAFAIRVRIVRNFRTCTLAAANVTCKALLGTPGVAAEPVNALAGLAVCVVGASFAVGLLRHARGTLALVAVAAVVINAACATTHVLSAALVRAARVLR